MRTTTIGFAVCCSLATCVAWADAMPGDVLAPVLVSDPYVESAEVLGTQTLPIGKTGFAYAYLSDESIAPLSLEAVSAQRWIAGMDLVDNESSRHLLGRSGRTSGALTIGYAWRKFKIEGSAFSVGPRDDPYGGKRELALLDSTSSRLSYSPSASWIFQVSRGNLSNLDQLEPGEELKRTALAASYRHAFAQGDWRTTLAWGRNVRKTTGSTVGYLLESTMRFGGSHAVFGRLERGRSDEDVLPSESAARELHRMNKLTVGYFYDLARGARVRYDVGGLVSRHLSRGDVPSPSGSDTVSGMMFVRFWLP